jgi:hypothetical protein
MLNCCANFALRSMTSPCKVMDDHLKCGRRAAKRSRHAGDIGGRNTRASRSAGGGGASTSGASHAGSKGHGKGGGTPGLPGRAAKLEDDNDFLVDWKDKGKDDKAEREPFLDGTTYYPTMLPFQEVDELHDSEALAKPALPANLAETEVRLLHASRQLLLPTLVCQC